MTEVHEKLRIVHIYLESTEPFRTCCCRERDAAIVGNRITKCLKQRKTQKVHRQRHILHMESNRIACTMGRLKSVTEDRIVTR